MQLDILAPFNGSMTEEKFTQNAGSGRSAAKQNDTISESSYEANSPVDSQTFIPQENIFISELGYFHGKLIIRQVRDLAKLYVSNQEDHLYFHIPRRILSFIDGCPSKVTKICISYDNMQDSLQLSTLDEHDDQELFPISTISFNLNKCLRFVENEGIKKEEEALFAVTYRQPIIVRAISSYLKKNA